MFLHKIAKELEAIKWNGLSIYAVIEWIVKQQQDILDQLEAMGKQMERGGSEIVQTGDKLIGRVWEGGDSMT